MVFPGVLTSGGVFEAKVIPQIQTIRALAGSGVAINSTHHFSGQVNLWDTTASSGSQLVGQEYCWLVERNYEHPVSGTYYDGKFVGYSADPASPVYEFQIAGGGGGGGTTVDVQTTSGASNVAADTIQSPHGS